MYKIEKSKNRNFVIIDKKTNNIIDTYDFWYGIMETNVSIYFGKELIYFPLYSYIKQKDNMNIYLSETKLIDNDIYQEYSDSYTHIFINYNKTTFDLEKYNLLLNKIKNEYENFNTKLNEINLSNSKEKYNMLKDKYSNIAENDENITQIVFGKLIYLYLDKFEEIIIIAEI